LTVWQKAHSLTLSVYAWTKRFPFEERFGLTVQLRKAAASIATNVAEGCGRFGARDFARFVSIASGSAAETEYHLLLARDLGYLSAEHQKLADAQVNEVKKMLRALHGKLTANG